MKTTAPSMTEAEFQQVVIDLAHTLGWRHNFVRRTTGKGRRWVTSTSCVGWPDLTLWHPTRGGLLFRELKSRNGSPSVEQLAVLSSLTAAGADAGIWWPVDLDNGTIQRELQPWALREAVRGTPR